jgi:acetaldehyde dehydrogenase (acetylating)
MAIKVKSVSTAAAKWDANAARAADDYSTEAQAAAPVWEAATKASKENYHKAITAAGIADRFLGGVTRAGAAKYARKIAAVATDRFAPGIHAAVSDYTERVTPFLEVIAGLSLPKRGPRGDPANYNRVEAVGKALSAKRLALLGVRSSSSS